MVTVDKRDLVNSIKHMKDIDGYDEGDCISRRAVLAVVNTLNEYDLSALDVLVDDGK